MFLAQSSNTIESQAPFYKNILEGIIRGEKDVNSESIDNAIKEAKEIANGNKTIFSIDNDSYYLVSTILLNYKAKLIELNKIEISTYQDVLKILK